MLSISKETFIIITIIVCVMALIALVANALVILAFIKTKQLRRQANYFAINLAITDIFIIAGPLSIWILIGWHNYTLFVFRNGIIISINAIVPFYKFWTILDATLMNASVTNLACLSFERYFAIVMPFQHRIYLTKERTILMCLATWVVSLATMAPTIAYTADSTKRYIHKATPVVLCCLAIITSYIFLLRHIFTRTRNNDRIRSRNNNRREAILSLRLSLLSIAFIICWSPITIFSFWVASHEKQIGISIEVQLVIVPILKFLSYVHSFLNPFLYIFGRPAFGEALKRLMSCNGTRDTCRLPPSSSYNRNNMASRDGASIDTRL